MTLKRESRHENRKCIFIKSEETRVRFASNNRDNAWFVMINTVRRNTENTGTRLHSQSAEGISGRRTELNRGITVTRLTEWKVFSSLKRNGGAPQEKRIEMRTRVV